MGRKITITISIAAMVAALTSHAQTTQSGGSFVLVGDPQLHSVSGGHIFQSSAISDAAVRVSRRNPEENLLAEYSFQALIDEATQLPGGREDDMVILLGDGTNVGCTGEYDRLDARLENVRDSGRRIVLWAHGNHDTYLSGTINDIYPHVGNQVGKSEVLEEMMNSEVPIDASWWKAPSRPVVTRAWNSLCWDNQGSVPINKGQWIARYTDSLGVKMKGARLQQGVYRLTADVKPESPLGKKNYQIIGRWFQPLSNRYATEAAANTPYLSYIVQGIDVGDSHRLILIDTSVCRIAKLNPEQNAGSNACIGQDQLDDIRAMAAATSKALLIGAHFPIHDLDECDQKSLLNILNTNGRPWSFFSAHTHAPHIAPISHSKVMSYANESGQPRYDYNAGSTTDWPMEAHRVILDGTATGVTMKKVSSEGEPKLAYDRSAAEATILYELCRHVTVAERLAALDVSSDPGATWKGGVRTNELTEAYSCHWYTPDYAERLKIAQETIKRRMSDTDNRYRDRIMMIMRGASLNSKEQPALQDASMRIVK